MVERIIDWSLRNPLLVLLATALLLFASIWAVRTTPLDVLPDLAPPQVIVEVNWPGQSPETINDQVVTPLVTSFLSVKDVETVRAFSSFESAMIYVIFDDGMDLYFSRDRIQEQFAQIQNRLPEGAQVTLGPDATGVGWVYQYMLKSESRSLDELRTLQDFYLRYALLGVEGVSEVASVGGFVREYQVVVDNERLMRFGLSIADVTRAIERNNDDVGGGVVLENGAEHIVTARGYLLTPEQIESVTIRSQNGLPITVADVAKVRIVPASRRGMADLNGRGEVVGGIVVARYGENAYAVAQRAKEQLIRVLPEDVTLVEGYYRNTLVDAALDTLKEVLIEESLIVLAVVAIFLLHARSALIIILTLPLTILITFLLMRLAGVESNIMSLGGIAIAIGAMVDAGIVMVENAHKHLSRQGLSRASYAQRLEAIRVACQQVGRPIFFALVLIIVSFLPVFALSGQEGRLFTPLAFTKTFAMVAGAALSITLVPVLIALLLSGRIRHEQSSPVNRFFIAIYAPLLRFCLRFRYLAIAAALLLFIAALPLYNQIRWEFMPPLHEQSVMYMPVTISGIGADLAKELMLESSRLIKTLPEVETVFGKVGRADTATDPAPLSMIESIITFKPREEWREGMTHAKLLEELDETVQIPGLINSWTFPIRGRIDMLLTGIRTPMGIKLYGPDPAQLERYARQIESRLYEHEGTLSAFADRSEQGYFISLDLDEERLARYGVDKSDLFEMVRSAIGGAQISTRIEGIETYPITVRLQDIQRDNITAIRSLRVPTDYGYRPLEQFATIAHSREAPVVKSEKGLRVAFIFITPRAGVAPGDYEREVDALLSDLNLPAGYYYEWEGQSRYLAQAIETLQYIVPVTLVLMWLLIYFALRDGVNALLVYTALPFAFVGGVVLMWLLEFNLSVAAAVGFLALLGIAAETAIVMIIYLDEALKKAREKYGTLSADQVNAAVFEGAVLRVRPKLMTVLSMLFGLLPLMLATGVGSEVMSRIAAPMMGGLISSTVLTLLIIPVLYAMVHGRKAGV